MFRISGKCALLKLVKIKDPYEVNYKELVSDKNYIIKEFVYNFEDINILKITKKEVLGKDYIVWEKTDKKDSKTKIIECEEIELENLVGESDFALLMSWYSFSKIFIFSGIKNNLTAKKLLLMDITDDVVDDCGVDLYCNGKRILDFSDINLNNFLGETLLTFKYNHQMGCHRIIKSQLPAFKKVGL